MQSKQGQRVTPIFITGFMNCKETTFSSRPGNRDARPGIGNPPKRLEFVGCRIDRVKVIPSGDKPQRSVIIAGKRTDMRIAPGTCAFAEKIQPGQMPALSTWGHGNSSITMIGNNQSVSRLIE